MLIVRYFYNAKYELKTFYFFIVALGTTAAYKQTTESVRFYAPVTDNSEITDRELRRLGVTPPFSGPWTILPKSPSISHRNEPMADKYAGHVLLSPRRW